MEEEDMEEEQQQEEPKSLLEQTKDATAARKAENDRTEALLVRMDEAKVNGMLGGTSDAGQAPAAKKESTPEEYAKAALAGEILE